jgi:predicted O-methyltransferase YrrM
LYIISKERLSKYPVKILKLSSHDALKEFQDRSLDFVYIDADHTFDMCCIDLIFWPKKVRSGGIIAAHDYYTPFWPGVTGAVDAYIHSHNIRPIYVTRERKMTAFWVNP